MSEKKYEAIELLKNIGNSYIESIAFIDLLSDKFEVMDNQLVEIINTIDRLSSVSNLSTSEIIKQVQIMCEDVE